MSSVSAIVTKPTGPSAIPSINEAQSSVSSRVQSVWKFVKENAISLRDWSVNSLYPKIKEAVNLFIQDGQLSQRSRFVHKWAAKNVLFICANLCLSTATYVMTGSLSAALSIGSASLLSAAGMDERVLALLEKEQPVIKEQPGKEERVKEQHVNEKILVKTDPVEKLLVAKKEENPSTTPTATTV